MNLSELILRRARMQPHLPAIIERKGTIATYGDLADRVSRTAAHLAALGVARGDQVGLCLKDDSNARS
jgi:acyl-CoA synthetase (AMP-forming)/AMP-acid ligase II